MGQPVNIAGKRFGKLVALKYSGISNKQGRLWDCILIRSEINGQG